MNIKLPHNCIIYVCVCLALMPTLMLRDYTPSNELRYLSIADEALRDHHFFAFYKHGEAYADKPPLYFWLLMLCRWLTGEYRMWMLSLFSLVPALGTLWVMDDWMKDETDPKHRHLAALTLATSGLFAGASIILRMDMLMTFFIVLALREFWRMYNAEECTTRSRWLFSTYLFLALFAKGPLGVLIPLCATTAYLAATRRISDFPNYWGWRTWGLLAILCALWFAGIYAEGGRAYLDNILVHQTVGRAVNSFHHKAPPYYYLLHIWYCIAPWSLLAAGALAAALRRKCARSRLVRFFQTVAISGLLLLSCISSKLQIYALPVVPFLVCPVAMLLPHFGRPLWIRMAVAVPALVFAMSLPALLLAAQHYDVMPWGGSFAYAAATILTATGLAALCELYAPKHNGSTEHAMRRLAIGLLLAIFAGGWGMPRINRNIGYGYLCKRVAEVSARYGTKDIRTWNLPRAECIDVYLGMPVKEIAQDSIPAPTHGKGYILVTRKSCLPQLGNPSNATVADNYAIIPFNQQKND